MLKQLVSSLLRPADAWTRVPTNQRDARVDLRAIGRLAWIWSSAGIVSFLSIMIFYTLFLGRNKVILNETIYENHRFVGQAGAFQLNSSEGYAVTSFGEDGLIVNKVMNPAAFRVVFIGDSFVKAKQVSDDEKFTEIVERDWNASHPDRLIQSLNLGLGGQDMRTYLSFGDNMDRRFQPHLVFLNVSQQDFFALKKSPKQLEKVAQGLDEPLTRPERATAFEDVMNQLGFRSFFGKLQEQTYGFLSSGKGVDQVEAAAKEAPLPETDAVVIQLEALKRIWGDRLVILYRAAPPDLGRDAAPTYDDAVLQEINRQGIPVINLYPVFWQAYQARTPPFGFNNSILGQGHLNKYGHQLVAAEIIKFMERNGDLF